MTTNSSLTTVPLAVTVLKPRFGRVTVMSHAHIRTAQAIQSTRYQNTVRTPRASKGSKTSGSAAVRELIAGFARLTNLKAKTA